MSSASKIEWTEQTWNPLVGCTIVSPGCTHCYAMRTAARLSNNPATPHYAGTVKTVNGKPVWTGTVALASERVLTEPLRRKKPTMYFVNSMSDLFHESVPDKWIDRIFAVMELTPQHTYQVLTKRAERLRDYMTARWPGSTQFAWGCRVSGAIDDLIPVRTKASIAAKQRAVSGNPLPNCWLGVSTERQKEADERIPHLLQTPAAVRFISAEPLLGAIDLTNIAPPDNGYGGEAHGIDTLSSFNRRLRGVLDWVIVGGESGPGARPMHPQWARVLRDQCKAAGVPFFFKQFGHWKPCEYTGAHADDEYVFDDGTAMIPVGKKAAGRLLDNRTHDDMPGRVAMASHHD